MGSVSSFEIPKSLFLVIFFIMDQENEWDIVRPITIILGDPTTYHAWSQNITVFLMGHKLCHYVTSSIPKLVLIPKSKAKTDADASMTTVAEDDYEARLEE